MKEKERIYELLREPNKVKPRHKEILLDLKKEQPFFSKLNYLLAIANEQANTTELNQEHIEEISVIQNQWENPDFEVSKVIEEPEPQIEALLAVQEDETINETKVEEHANPEHTISVDFDEEVAEQETRFESSDEVYTSTYIENLKKLGLSHLIPSHVVQEEANATEELPIASPKTSELKSEVDEVHAAKSEDSNIEQENESLATTAADSITEPSVVLNEKSLVTDVNSISHEDVTEAVSSQTSTVSKPESDVLEELPDAVTAINAENPTIETIGEPEEFAANQPVNEEPTEELATSQNQITQENEAVEDVQATAAALVDVQPNEVNEGDHALDNNTAKGSLQAEPVENLNETVNTLRDNKTVDLLTQDVVLEEENTITTNTELKAFEDWLSLGPDAIAVTKSTLENPVAKKEEIIEKFIKKAPKIKLAKPDKHEQKPVSLELEEGFKSEWATETLADIYIVQRKYELAERCYNALSLKYPEKSDYFAGRIVELNAIRTQN